MRVEITVRSPIAESFRVAQVRGMFDLPAAEESAESFAAELPDLSQPWRIGAIVGPSGSGKSTLARAAYGERVYAGGRWPRDRAVIDGFPRELDDIRRVCGTLNAVGFSSPPAWLRPFHVLSEGEKFRCELARALLSGEGRVASGERLVVFDEFTSTVDRTVAKVASSALAKHLRRGDHSALRTPHSALRFIAVTCHYDVLPWLAPDWWLDLSTGETHWRSLRRPRLRLEVAAVDPARAWPLFRRHHYLSASHAAPARAWCAFLGGRPVAYTAWIYRGSPHHGPAWREHRTVVLPDFQGVGLGNRLSELAAGLVRGRGCRAYSTTSHPAMIRHRAASRRWKLCRHGQVLRRPQPDEAGSGARVTACFEYVGRGRAHAGLW